MTSRSEPGYHAEPDEADRRWQTDAGCLDHDPELFFAKEDTDGAAEALAICKACPVVDDCLEFALDTRQDYGVWGGMTENNRMALRRRRQRTARTLSERTLNEIRYLLSTGTDVQTVADEYGLPPAFVARLDPQQPSLDLTA